ncbi:response regulator transcription factor [bacterium]|nr:response regulator transcription factor [bacterium]
MPKLLIIEDQPNFLESLRLALEGPYYRVRCVEDAEQGMLYVLNWEPDVVIADYALPGMDGIELIKRINIAGVLPVAPLEGKGDKGNNKPGIILLSARMDEDLEQKALAAGADRCLAKPFDLAMLTTMIRELIKI